MTQTEIDKLSKVLGPKSPIPSKRNIAPIFRSICKELNVELPDYVNDNHIITAYGSIKKLTFAAFVEWVEQTLEGLR
jgi:hypothetical protein